MQSFENYFRSSIGRKQIVALTGLILILFIIGHLAGNLFVYWGPEAFNHYAQKLAGFRPGLYIIEVGLLFVFFTHIYFTYLLVLENIRARGQFYNRFQSKSRRSLSTRLMPFTGTILFIFVLIHLIDFTFVDKTGPLSMVNGESLGLYGIVYNAFSNVWHSAFYIVAMCCLGFHLNHGVQSIVQTFGMNHPVFTPLVKGVGSAFALIMTVGYSFIPLYVMYLSGTLRF